MDFLSMSTITLSAIKALSWVIMRTMPFKIHSFTLGFAI